MRELVFTIYSTARTSAGAPRRESWDGWCDQFEGREIREAKDGKAVVLGEIPAGKKRNGSNVRAAHAIGIDVEKLADDRVEAAFTAIDAFEYYAWTTHSHQPSAPRLRVILPFAEPIEPSDYPETWSGLNRLVGGINDPATRDVGRLHYLPSAPPAAPGHAAWRHEGRWISIDDLPPLQDHDAALPTPAPSARAVRHTLHKIRHRLRSMANSDPLKNVGRILAEGGLIAEPGERHDAIIDLTWWIGEKYTDLGDATLEALFAPSLESMRREAPGDPVSLAEVIDAYRGAIVKIRRNKLESSRLKEDEDRKDREERSHDRQIEGTSGPYSDDDLRVIAGAQGWDIEHLKKRWIIQHDGLHWFLANDGTYHGPYSERDAPIVSSQVLARAPVRLIESTKQSFRYRSMAEIAREVGQVADKVLSDMIDQHTRFDPLTKIMHEAIRPLRPIEPVFDEEINTWLRHLAGPHHGRLIDWIACVPDLNKLLCAVYFDGIAGSGKTLIAMGLARLWTEGPPADIELVLGDFNDEIARCPLILADEEIPKPYRTATVTTKLRSMVSTMQRTLKRKFKPPTELRGAIRLILAANNEFLLDSRDVSSSQDLDAIAQRFLYISVPKESTDFLNGLSRQKRERWATDAIAAHALWLAKNHEVKEPGKRFWVEGDVSQMHRLLMTGSRWNSLACEWLVRYCMEPNLFDAKGSGLIRRDEGELLVNDQALIDGWDLYIKNTKLEPETAKIGAALRAISAPKRRQLKTSGVRIRFRIVDVDHLLAWSDRHNIGDREQILESLGQAPIREPGDDPHHEDFNSVPAVNREDTPF